jgi:hypothetical protein
MKKRIIRLTIALTGLVVSFLPQKAAADICGVECDNGSCIAIGSVVNCYCDADGNPVCAS